MVRKKTDKDHKKLTLSKALSSGFNGDIFADIVLGFPDIIHSVDEHGNIVSTNHKASELLGYTRDELIGMPVLNLYADEVRQNVKVGFEILKKTGLQEGINSKLQTKSGEIIDVEIRSLSLYDEQGTFVKTFSIIRDMQELHSLKTQIIQQGKLAALGELASGIMHDIRNPLTVISTYNHHFLKEAIIKQNWTLVQKCQQNIEKASTRIQRLSDHLREYTRSEKEAFAPILCSELLEDCLLMLETRAHMVGAHIHRHIQPVNLIFQARRNQLEQVLINLIANACDALKDQPIKTIYISAQEIHHKEGSQVYISIKDTGAGIKEEDLERIFEAFYTTKPKGQGTGLGLSTAEGIIKEHQGHLEVKSECGKGTEFIVKLPMQQTP